MTKIKTKLYIFFFNFFFTSIFFLPYFALAHLDHSLEDFSHSSINLTFMKKVSPS
jgi:hypothetical protein